MKRLLLACLPLLAAPMLGHAQSALPFARDMAEGHELPRPYGVGVDVFSMHQDYRIESLSFVLPGVSLDDPSVIGVKNRAWNTDVKVDAWVLPFLNVFGVFGHIEGDTDVDLSRVNVPGLPPGLLGTLPISYDGTMYGGGATLAYANDRFFASLTGSITRSNLSGDFDSSVHARTLQPRIGLVHGEWNFWIGGFYLDAEEKHSGTIDLPGLGGVPFAVKLASDSKWNPTAGVHYDMGRRAEVSVEFGGGDRTMTLANFTWRFGE